MKKIFTIVAMSVLSLASFNMAFANSTPKIAVANTQRVLQDSPKVAEVNKKLQDEFQARQEALTERQKMVQDEVTDLTKNESVMDPSDVKAAQEKIVADRAEFLKDANAFQQDFNKAQTTYMKEIIEALNVTVKELAEKKGYSVIIDSQAVAFADPSLDVTQDLVDAFQNS